ncbi:glycosyltransferase [Cardinium endosymbiont of Oedothorax gibbosus]|uniref:glycosyltransferase n=1 Tax=Cardinium endosymbiont of Oedothorax gibbosus TaxID=931101 RepID=UPI002024F11F|nr:glycosyltransferase [Cardinium endosymbiont of Oedothorax gibbosus]CAH2560139.1 DPM1-like family protein [Cardinium endosymbiont of Oedothorax gibbosus]
MSGFLRAIVVIPTYNERENIESLLTAIFALKIGVHVLVVDDHSPDGTAGVVIRLQQRYPHQLHLLSRPQKEGLGQAYLAGFGWALMYDYDYICSMDADFSHAPLDLLQLLTRCATPTIDIVIGSRYITGGRVVNWPLSRILLSCMANWLARSITGMPIKDTTAGFVCYRRTILQHILNRSLSKAICDEQFLGQEQSSTEAYSDMFKKYTQASTTKLPLAMEFQKNHNIVSVGYSFQVEIKFLAYQYGAKLVELPITFINRVRGKSKMGLIMAGESLFRLIQMKWRSWKRQ